MDKIINYLLLVIIFVFDPLAIALVIAANFAFARLKKPTKENLYGEVVEIDGAEGMEVECSVPEGREFNTPYDINELLKDEEEIEKRVDIIGQNGNEGLHYEEKHKPLKNETKIKSLQYQIDKIQKNDSTGRSTSQAIANLNSQIKKLRDEDNTITY